MTESSLRRNTGIFGLVATLIWLTQLPLYFMYEGAPPQWDILTRVLVSIIGSAILVLFLTGFRLVIRQASHEMEWASTIALVSGLLGKPALRASLLGEVLGDATWQPTFVFYMGYPKRAAHASPRRPIESVIL